MELLNAQRTADDTYLDYLDALATYARAKAQIQISVGERPDLEADFKVFHGPNKE
jgi:cobalt-zinc-cadmium efflux system outer membrane protein